MHFDVAVTCQELILRYTFDLIGSFLYTLVDLKWVLVNTFTLFYLEAPPRFFRSEPRLFDHFRHN